MPNLSLSLPLALPVSIAVAALSGAARGQTLDEDRKITPDAPADSAVFGDSVAMHDGLAVVGAAGVWTQQIPGFASIYDLATGGKLADLPIAVTPQERLVVYGCGAGPGRVAVGIRVDGQSVYTPAVWLFDTTTPASPTLVDVIQPKDAEFADAFGDAIAIDGTLMIVGASGDDVNGGLSGSAYLFDTTTGAELSKLVPDDGSSLSQFGFSVDIKGDLVIVGARWESETAHRAGAAYLFDISDPMNPVQTAKLLASDGMEGDFFGFDVAIDGTLALVGAIFNDEAGFDAGAAYVYDISDPSSPSQAAKILTADANDTDDLGWAVDLEGTTALITARTDDDVFPGAGSAYLFDLGVPASPVEMAKLVPTDTAANAVFGWSGEIEGSTVLIGASQDNEAGTTAGAAYVFTVPGAPCPADTNGDGLLTPADFSAWIIAFNSQAAACDQNADGLCTPADFSAWIIGYNAGCD